MILAKLIKTIGSTLFGISCLSMQTPAQKPVPVKPRILISTDIGGTDPDDNQSMTHFLMYSHLFNTEVGNQDVLFLNNEKSRQYFWKCYIEGTTDFIFGSATAWFDSCEIYSKKNSHITAASTPQNKEWGFVFSACKLTGDTSLHNVSLGRPWRPYGAVVYMNCYIGPHIKPEGWSNWNNTENYKTTRYAEYKNYGPSSDPTKRVSWSRQLTDEEAKAYDLKKYRESWYPLRNRQKTSS